MHQCQDKAYLYYVECKSIHTQPLKKSLFLNIFFGQHWDLSLEPPLLAGLFSHYLLTAH